MAKNIELKAYAADLGNLERKCIDVGGVLVRSEVQTDVYYDTREGRLKIRSTEEDDGNLIFYRRLDAPEARESDYTLLPLAGHAGKWIDVMDRALGRVIEVRKLRRTYRLRGALVNLDEVDELGAFVEIEVEVENYPGDLEARLEARWLQTELGISAVDVLPFSYSDLRAMHEKGKEYRCALLAGDVGTAFLLDGASASGKTTIKQRLLEAPDPPLTFVPRYCTRPPRPSERVTSDYIFTDQNHFAKMRIHGEFIEYRDFLFGMSYGLPWKETVEGLASRRDILAIINLGNVRHVKNIFPESVCILITASDDVLRSRLVARGTNTAAQIEERLENARLAVDFASYYDYVVKNEADLESAIATVKDIVRGRSVRQF